MLQTTNFKMSSTDSYNKTFASMRTNSDKEEERPLQIIEVLGGDNDDKSNDIHLKLNEKSLETVLKSTKGRILSIVAIVGPPNCGKTIILNYIKRGLEAKESGRKNKVGDQHEFLAGFKYSNKESNQGTCGIWVWSRAFLIDGEDDVAVLLLDTQGLSDSKASRAIFGLSFLSSSILIYNVPSDYSDTPLFKPLTTYFKYGLCCFEKDKELSEEDPPFQKLIFIFRDWHNSHQYAFGRKGGKSLMDDKLGSLRGRLGMETKAGLNCFQQVLAYVLPTMVTGSTSTFQGSLKELSEEFANQLDKFTVNLLKEENLLPKNNFGTQLKSLEFSNFLKQYIKMFNNFLKENRDIYDEELILDTACKTFHQNIVSKALEKYHEIFNKRSEKMKIQNKDDIQSIHETAVRQANIHFRRARKLEEYAQTYNTKLQKEMQIILEEKLADTSTSCTDFVEKCFKKAKESFKTKLLNEPDFTLKKADKLKDSITQEFLENLESCDEETPFELASSLQAALDDVLELVLDQKSLHDQKNVQDQKTFYDQISQQPMQNLDMEVDQKYEDKMTEITHKSPSSNASIHIYSNLPSFAKTTENFGKVTVADKFGNEFRSKMEKSIQQIHRKTQKSTSKLQEFEPSLDEELKVHTKDGNLKIMENKDSQGLFTSENSLKDILTRNKTMNNVPSPPEKAEKVGAVENCLQQYAADMHTLGHGAEFLEASKLTKHHQNSRQKALSTYEKYGNGDSTDYFNNRLDEEFARLNLENERLIELACVNGKNWVNECHKEYQQQIKLASDSCTSSKEFQQAHEKLKKSIILSFGKKWKYKCHKNFQQEHEKKLEIEMDATFEETAEFLQMRIKTDVFSVEELKFSTRKYYHAEMGKHTKPKVHMEPIHLQDLHKRTVKAAIVQCKVKTPLKKNQKKILKGWLEESYQKYKDENDMALNYEDGAESAIGIDLGTTYCCVAAVINGKVEILRNQPGQKTTPSYVRISPQGGEKVVGDAAKSNAYRNAENTVFDAKRMIGRRFEDIQLQNDMKFWPFTVVQGEEGPVIEVFGCKYPPEQIASFILRQLVKDAELILGRSVSKAVITVPAYFSDGQRQATIDAGVMAGLQVLTILNEPTAASIAYKLERFHEDARNVLIFDLGGGTFDVAIIQTDAGDIKIIAVDGDTHLGGEDFDKEMMQYCAKQFQIENSMDPFKGKDSGKKVKRDKAKQRLRRLQSHCEKGKIELSFAPSTTISLDSFQETVHLEVVLSREKFEELISPYITKTLEIVERALKTAKMAKVEIDDIVLVGGSTRIPKVRDQLSQYFNGKALNHTINPDEAVAYGAAVKAALMNGDQAKKMFNFTNIQDVTPMSLGVEAWVKGEPGNFSVIIPKCTQIPNLTPKNFSTLLDNQETVLVKIYQGEALLAKDNEFLGEFGLKGIPPAPAGKESVDVLMKIDDTGILHVEAVCKSTSGSATLVVSEYKGRLSEKTKKKLLQEATVSDEAALRRSMTLPLKSEKQKVDRVRPKSSVLGRIFS